MPSTRPSSGGPVQLPDSARPRVADALQLTFDRVRDQHMLLGPESVLALNPTGAAILRLCDGRRTVAEIVTELRSRFADVKPGEVRNFLDHLAVKRCVEVDHDQREHSA